MVLLLISASSEHKTSPLWLSSVSHWACETWNHGEINLDQGYYLFLVLFFFQELAREGPCLCWDVLLPCRRVGSPFGIVQPHHHQCLGEQHWPAPGQAGARGGSNSFQAPWLGAGTLQCLRLNFTDSCWCSRDWTLQGLVSRFESVSLVELEIPSLVGLAQSESFNIQSKKISCCTRLEQEEAASLWNLFKT